MIQAALGPNYDYVTAFSGAECLKLLKDQPPDLIIMDVMMQTLTDGLDTATAIKTNEATRQIPVLLLTGVNDHYNYRDQINDNYFPRDCWLNKPINTTQLKATVTRLLA